MDYVPVTVDNGKKKLDLRMYPYDTCSTGYSIGFSIILQKNKELYIQLSEYGKKLQGVNIRDSNGNIIKPILTSDGNGWINFASNNDSLLGWNDIKGNLEKRVGLPHSGEVTSTHELLEDIHSLLGELKNNSFKITKEDIEYVLEDIFQIRLNKSKSSNNQMYMQGTIGIFKKGLMKLPDYFLNFSNVNRLALAYANPEMYSSPDMFSPPAERKNHVLRLELTQGCNYNACTFCDGYKGVPYKEKNYKQFLAHFKEVGKNLRSQIEYIRRVFIGGGNALSVNQSTLLKALNLIHYELHPKRIAIYGRADSITQKGIERLSELKSVGLKLIYWGVESGSDKVLKYVNKGTTLDKMLSAGDMANRAKIDLSVMLMPGLGGIKYSESHIKKTINFLNEVEPKYITFMGVNPNPSTEYAKRMREETKAGTNKNLTDKEMIQQLEAILSKLYRYRQKVGMFDDRIDRVGKNPIKFNETFDSFGKELALSACKRYLEIERH